MSRKPSKPETRIEDYLDVMTGGNAALPQPILRIEFYYAFLAGMAVELPQPILDDEKLLAKICGMGVEAPTYIPGISPRLYAYMAKKGGQDVQVPDPILRLECYWYDYSAGEAPSVQEYTGAVPVTFVADGTPLIDYLISGNTVQNGTPTPDSPITPQGTGERTGNLFDAATAYGAMYSDGVITGQANAINDKKNKVTADMIGKTYTISITPLRIASKAFMSITINGTTYWRENELTVNQRSSFQFTPVTENDQWYITYDIGDVCSYKDIMVNEGSTALPYEPYGYKIPISSANATTPIYLGEVETTRKVKKLMLTGEETNWYYYENETGTTKFFYLVLVRVVGVTLNDLLNTHGFNTIEVAHQSGNIFIRIYAVSEGMETIEEWKSYLAAQYAAGTPVTVWYVLATEETVVVNEPLMKIGDYADTLSREQAGAQIPTVNGSTTLDVDTTVKPSEVYIKYRGDAVATLSTLPAEVSSPEATEEEDNPEETEETENER
ncbi:MAG: hypothetical protein KBI35_09570 [Ruminococcus sp.]|nr:hypothetical protein [Ruminococcus sp.]